MNCLSSSMICPVRDVVLVQQFDEFVSKIFFISTLLVAFVVSLWHSHHNPPREIVPTIFLEVCEYCM
jgi:hypothetical protein